MDRSSPRVRASLVITLASALISVGLATMGGIVARATPAAAARLSYGVVRNHVDLTDTSRSTPPRGSHGSLPYRYLPTDLYLPDGPGPFAAVVFAAGFDIRTDAYAPMLMQWAAAGYLVAAPQFPISGLPSDGPARRDDMSEEPGDVSYVIDWLLSATADPSSPVAGRVEAGRLGVAGHSDGATDAAAIAYNSLTRDPRVQAVMVLSGDQPAFAGTTNGPFNTAPVLVMSGTADQLVPLSSADTIYATAAAPKVQVRLEGASHLEPYVSDDRFTGVAWNTQIDFLDATLRNDPTARVRLIGDGSTAGVATMRQEGLQPNPFGSLDAVTADPLGTVTVSGWSIDPDTGGPTPVDVWVDSQFAGEYVAGQPRPDVGAAYPDLGADHGFTVSLAHEPTGQRTVCVFAMNVGLGDTNVELGCQVVAVATNPFGSLDRVTVDPLLRAFALGWALDADTTAPVVVHAYVDGVKVATGPADTLRPDIAAAFPGFGASHGFVVPLPVMSQGPHDVCLYGINVGAGTANSLLGSCARVFVDHDPFGVIDATSIGVGGTLRVTGWAVDPDAPGPVGVHVYVDGVRRAELTATLNRPDVAAALAGGGAQHGFDVTLAPLGEGNHTLCAYAINTGAGATNPLIDHCRVFFVSHLPFGTLDKVTVFTGRAVAVTGWAIDPDTTASIGVHVYVDSTMVASGSAPLARLDVAAAFPPFGAGHGYAIAAGTVKSGLHQVCVYGINVSSGHNELLSCQSFTAA